MSELTIRRIVEATLSFPPLVADSASIVLRGDLRPVIISPTWLREQDLIGSAEYDEATFELLIPNEASVFNAGWLRCQAAPDSLELQTEQQAESERLRDLVVGLLKASPDKPVSLLGINRIVHFLVDDLDEWNAIGDHVVRNDIWDSVLHLAAMRTATFWGQRTDSYGGRIQVQVEPSFRFHPGVFVAYNDHYDLTTVKSQPASREELQSTSRPEPIEATVDKISVALEILTSEWEASFQRSISVIQRVWEQARPKP